MGTKPVATKDAKGKPISRWYHIKIEDAINANSDLEEAVVSIPEDRLVKAFGGETVLDLTSAEQEYKLGYFPVNQVFQQAGWRRSYGRFCS